MDKSVARLLTKRGGGVVRVRVTAEKELRKVRGINLIRRRRPWVVARPPRLDRR